MSRASRVSVLRAATLVVLVAGIAVAPAVAAVTLQVDTEYRGVEGESQSVSVRTVVSPEGSTMTDAEVTIQPSTTGFVDYSSFETTLKPGNADINVTYVGRGTFRVEELEPNEQVVITFEAYPREIKTRSLDVASVSLSYVQNGQELSTDQPVTADLSSSSWFAYRQAQDRARNWRLMGFAGGGVVVLGLVAGAVVWFRRRTDPGDGEGGNGGAKRGPEPPS